VQVIERLREGAHYVARLALAVHGALHDAVEELAACRERGEGGGRELDGKRGGQGRGK
jgi:hypothetical protein